MPTVSTNYFEIFSLSPSFDIDLQNLEALYRQLQLEHHPDKFAGESEALKMQAVQTTSLINSAYETLKSPLSRAGYLLTLRGLDIEAVSQSDLGMDLLMEQMQMREALAELPEDESSLAQLDELKRDAKSKIAAREKSFLDNLNTEDFAAAKRMFHEMQFLFKLLKEIESGEEQRLGY